MSKCVEGRKEKEVRKEKKEARMDGKSKKDEEE